jgi:CubicO group peptidase (beta-lactamase class C family)
MKLLLCVILGLITSLSSYTASEQDVDFNTLMIQKYMEGAFHGGILYSDSKGEVHQFALGVANPNTGEVLNTKHRFAINSMGKMFTSVLIMQLIEEGKLRLDDSIDKHLPNFEHTKASEITIHHLLSHRSGLPDYFLNQLRGEIPFGLDQSEILERIISMEMDFEPDTAFQYSNTGYILLADIIMKYRSGNFEEILTKYIFSVLGMNQSSVTDKTKMTAYFSGDGSINYYSDEMELVGDGQGGSSLKDMYLFLSALGSEKLLKPDSWELIFTPHSLPSEVPEGAWPPPHQDPYGYGFGLMPVKADGKTYTMVGHGGAGYGSNYAGRILGTKKVIVIYNNMMKNPILTDVFQYVASQ